VNQGKIQADAFVDERGSYVPAEDVVVAADGSASYRDRPVTRRAGKMGKSLKNGISPDRIYEQYGADTLRLYEMAMGPLEADKPWRTDDIVGVHRFLQRLWRSMVSERTGAPTVSDAPLDDATLRLLHATIAAVRHDFELLRFNTAIARLIELTAAGARISAAAGALPRALAEPLVLMIAPLAPHVAEELWAKLGHREFIADAPFPAADPALAQPRSVTIPVQVNGRTRFRVDLPAGLEAPEIEAVVRADPEYARWIAESRVERLIIVPGRIVNIIMR
jgi:leucyl-tRNA synthetase